MRAAAAGAAGVCLVSECGAFEAPLHTPKPSRPAAAAGPRLSVSDGGGGGGSGGRTGGGSGERAAAARGGSAVAAAAAAARRRQGGSCSGIAVQGVGSAIVPAVPHPPPRLGVWLARGREGVVGKQLLLVPQL